MSIYVIYKDGVVVTVTTLARIVLEEFNNGSDYVEMWIKEKRVKMFKSGKDFSRFINPRPSEDEPTGGSDYEW